LKTAAHNRNRNTARTWEQRLPDRVCLRVTRNCNAHCRFCLAPPDGGHPDYDTLAQRIDWLLSRGVSIFHLCGGEPTIHPGLARLIEHIHARGGKARLTTNAIAIPDTLITVLRVAETEVKTSLHGDRSHHNNMVGVRSFDHTQRNIRRLVDAGVRTSIQTTVVADADWVVDWVADYCLEVGIRRLSVLPFIPRGRGDSCKSEFALSPQQRRRLRDHVKNQRRQLIGRVDVRWLDFTSRPIHVVEADGSVVLEAATDAMDQVLGRIPMG
jgi:MoaA/NifB/PqqE/SkfB family radical SAM enzyme